jgi:hypothetical protein
MEKRSSVPRLDVKKLIPNFNPDQSDISLYLIIFECQVIRAVILKENWVTSLLGLMPLDIVQLIAREPETVYEDYDHIKAMLLKKFKLSPEIFRQKFVQHPKKTEVTWKDFTFEITNYIEEWISGLKIQTLEELKGLLVCDQFKKRRA